MAEKPRHLSKTEAPDPSNVYERSHPENESGMGRLDTNRRATPTKSADQMPATVSHAQDGSRQLNAHDQTAPAKTAASESVKPSKKKK